MSETNSDAERSGSGPRELSDEELNRYILARLESLGVDLSVLPEDDPDAPADRRRILRAARRFLRDTPSAITAFELEPDEAPPVLYPTELRARRRDTDGTEDR